MGWIYLSIPKLQRLHPWSLGMEKWFHPTLYNGCNYLSVLGLKLYHVRKRGPRRAKLDKGNCAVVNLQLVIFSQTSLISTMMGVLVVVVVVCVCVWGGGGGVFLLMLVLLLVVVVLVVMFVMMRMMIIMMKILLMMIVMWWWWWWWWW